MPNLTMNRFLFHLAPWSLALAALSAGVTPATPQIPLNEVVFENPRLPGQPTDVNRFQDFTCGEDSGWVGRTFHLGPNGLPQNVFVGVLSATDPLGPRLLRVPQPLAGTSQYSVYRPSLAGSKIAYLSTESLTNTTRSAWLDDQLIAKEGTSIGLNAGVWQGIVKVQAATNGSVMIRGTVVRGGQEVALAVEHPSGQVLIEEGQPVPGTGETIKFILSTDRSPDGNHLAAVVRLEPSNHRALLLDGAIVTLNGGVLARTLEPVGSVFTYPASYPGALFLDFERPRVNSSGDLAFQAVFTTTTFEQELNVRNGRQMLSSYGIPAKAIDERGFVVSEGSFGGVRDSALEIWALGQSNADIDVDGDGLADPGYQFEPDFSTPGEVDMTGSGEIYLWGSLQNPAGDRLAVVVRRDLTPGGEVVCPGEVNSTGYRARLSAFGTSVVAFNRTELIAIGLPPHVFALPLFSLTPNPGGFQPPASDGTLCLGGAVGRGVNLLMFSSLEGVGSTQLLLNVLPQPGGPVAVQAGSTWYSQLWYRDMTASGPTSNFSDAIGIQFG